MDDLATRLVTALCVLLIGAYAIGWRANRRTGRALARWVREGLAPLGGQATIRWLGSSGFVIEARGLADPLASLTATALLEPREVAPLWLYHRLRGRRDLLVIRCRLRRPPQAGVEIAAPASPAGQAALAQVEAEGGWAIRRHNGHVVATKGAPAEVGERLWGLFRQHAASLWQISVRGSEPHLQVSLSPGRGAGAGATWKRLVEAARLVSGSEPDV